MIVAVRHRPAVALAVLIAALALPASSSARFYGSSLRRPANVNFGCEVAPFFNTFSPSGFSFGASGHRTCTWRPLGYLGRLGTGGTLASNGIIRRVQIRAGRRPAPLRLTILQSSSRLSPGGGTLQNSFTCCTARRFSRVLRPRANRITTFRVNMRVYRSVDTQAFVQTNDVIGISGVGRGTLPLRVGAGLGGYTPGNAFSAFYYPLTRVGDPRLDGSGLTGIEVLLRWEFIPARRR